MLLLLLASVVAGCTGTVDNTSPRRHRAPAVAAGQARAADKPQHSSRSRDRHKRSRHHRHAKPQVAIPAAAGVPASAMPNHALTPGRARTTRASVVCVPGYSSRVRDVPSSESERVYTRYGVAHVPYAHEVDHLVSLELGGSNAITNLWPEPYAGRWGARTKDVLENRLHDLVCSGSLDLRYAQRIEAANWVAAYKKYVGAPPPAQAPSHPAPSPKPAAHAAPDGSCEPGYAPCLPRVSDLNCDDIPADKKPVRVTGSDPYGLDADGDGYGCTS
ncbi:MAG: hypothetical protein ACXVEU_08320 [Nocardioidaceae bacterium]